VDEVAPRPVRTESGRVECSTKIRFILGVTVYVAHLTNSVSELTLVAIATGAVLLVRTTQLCLVAVSLIDLQRRLVRRDASRRRRLASDHDVTITRALCSDVSGKREYTRTIRCQLQHSERKKLETTHRQLLVINVNIKYLNIRMLMNATSL